MEPISVIMAALIAGATSGLTQGTSGVINKALSDAYDSLKKLIVEKSPKKVETKELLENYDNDQGAWEGIIKRNIEDNELDKSNEIVKEAEKLLVLLLETNKTLQKKELPTLVHELNTFGGKVIIVGGNVNNIEM